MVTSREHTRYLQNVFLVGPTRSVLDDRDTSAAESKQTPDCVYKRQEQLRIPEDGSVSYVTSNDCDWVAIVLAHNRNDVSLAKSTQQMTNCAARSLLQYSTRTSLNYLSRAPALLFIGPIMHPRQQAGPPLDKFHWRDSRGIIAKTYNCNHRPDQW